MKKGKYEPGDFILKVKRSTAGLGLYAGQDIPKGTCVIEYVGRVISKEEETTSRSQYLFEINKNKTIDGSIRSNTARYINYSHRPNCEPEIHAARVFIFSKRAIKEGEELSYDYGKAFYDEHIKPKGCKCVRCAPDLHTSAKATTKSTKTAAKDTPKKKPAKTTSAEA